MKKIKTIILEENENFKYSVSLSEQIYNELKAIAIRSKRSWYFPSKQEIKTLEYIKSFKTSIGKDMYKILLEKLKLNEELINKILER